MTEHSQSKSQIPSPPRANQYLICIMRILGVMNTLGRHRVILKISTSLQIILGSRKNLCGTALKYSFKALKFNFSWFFASYKNRDSKPSFPT